MDTSLNNADVVNLLNGEAISRYEDDFDKNLIHREVSINVWNKLGFQLFGEGKEGVLIGQDGWLFTNEEFTHGQDFEQIIQSHKDFILQTAKQLEEKNIKLVIVSVPSKARIYRDKLGRYEFPSYWQDQYLGLRDFFKANKIASVDLLNVFEKNKSENIYLKTDTHWTPMGARLAALKTDYLISAEFPYLTWERKKFTSTKLEEEAYEGDLMRYTVTGGSAEKMGLKKDHFMRWETKLVAGEASDDLFGDVTLPVTLVGTSYSANKTWNFAGFLKEVLGTDILNVADEGLGPFEVMKNYLSSEAYKNTQPKLVIWEMPERYLAISSVKKETK